MSLGEQETLGKCLDELTSELNYKKCREGRKKPAGLRGERAPVRSGVPCTMLTEAQLCEDAKKALNRSL